MRLAEAYQKMAWKAKPEKVLRGIENGKEKSYLAVLVTLSVFLSSLVHVYPKMVYAL